VKSLYDFPDVFEVVMRRAPGAVEAEVRSVLELLARSGRGYRGRGALFHGS
jgi:hypothetical protein